LCQAAETKITEKSNEPSAQQSEEQSAAPTVKDVMQLFTQQLIQQGELMTW
jgi:hypothetical protein